MGRVPLSSEETAVTPPTCLVCGDRKTIAPGFYRGAVDGDNTTCRACSTPGSKPIRGQMTHMVMLDDAQEFSNPSDLTDLPLEDQ